jgi:hypothetical protein
VASFILFEFIKNENERDIRDYSIACAVLKSSLDLKLFERRDGVSFPDL